MMLTEVFGHVYTYFSNCTYMRALPQELGSYNCNLMEMTRSVSGCMEPCPKNLFLAIYVYIHGEYVCVLLAA